MSEMDYTYAERWNRTGYKYATPIDESVATEVVDALGDSLEADAGFTGAIADAVNTVLADTLEADTGLTGAIADAVLDVLVNDATYPAALGAALAADDTYREGVADYLATDAEYLAGITDAIATNLVATYAVNVPTEATVPTSPFDSDPLITPTHTFDPVTYLGDQGISPGTVGVAFLLSDGISTEVYLDNGAGVLTGNAGGIGGNTGGTGTINYDTGVMTITWGTLSAQTASEAVSNIAYDYLVNAFEPEVVVSPASLTSVANTVATTLASDIPFLDAVQNRVFPIWWVDTDVSTEAAEVVTVTFTQVGMDAQAETGRAQAFRLFLYSDQIGTAVLPVGITMAATTGMILGPIVATKEIQVMTDSVTGTLVLEFTDASGQTVTFDVVLVNDVTGECHTATCVFTA